MGGGADEGGGQVEGGDGFRGGDKGGHGYHIIGDGNSGSQGQKASKYDKCLKKELGFNYFRIRIQCLTYYYIPQ